MIRAIFFDFDGVLTLDERGSTTTIQVIQESAPDLSAAKVQHCYYRFHHKLLLGEKNHLDIWSDYCKCIGKDVDPVVLKEAFSRTPMNKDMIQLASGLATDYRVGIITDNAKDRMAFLIGEHGLAELFAPIVVSAHVGKLKDDIELFEVALQLSGHGPEESIFIDNQERNLVVPARLGFKTYLFDPTHNDIPRLRSQLAQWGIRV
jgi:FMN phosphatase YigB (HAD superfamily)